jgi:hypothetical protein
MGENYTYGNQLKKDARLHDLQNVLAKGLNMQSEDTVV